MRLLLSFSRWKLLLLVVTDLVVFVYLVLAVECDTRTLIRRLIMTLLARVRDELRVDVGGSGKCLLLKVAVACVPVLVVIAVLIMMMMVTIAAWASVDQRAIGVTDWCRSCCR